MHYHDKLVLNVQTHLEWPKIVSHNNATYLFQICQGANSLIEGGSLGLVVMGGDSCSEGREFESQHHILDGHFSHINLLLNCNEVCLK